MSGEAAARRGGGSEHAADSSSGLQVATEAMRSYAVPLLGLVLASALALSTLSGQGPTRYYPFMLVGIVGLLAVINALGAIGGSARGTPRAESRTLREVLGRNRRGLSVTLIVVAYWYTIPWLGFYTTTGLMLFVCCIALGVSWLRALVYTLLLLVVAYLVFSRVVNVPLPLGLVG